MMGFSLWARAAFSGAVFRAVTCKQNATLFINAVKRARLSVSDFGFFLSLTSCFGPASSPPRLQPPPSRKPSEEQRRVSASLVEAMMMPDLDGGGAGGAGGVRAGLVLDPVRQSVSRCVCVCVPLSLRFKYKCMFFFFAIMVGACCFFVLFSSPPTDVYWFMSCSWGRWGSEHGTWRCSTGWGS